MSDFDAIDRAVQDVFKHHGVEDREPDALPEPIQTVFTSGNYVKVTLTDEESGLSVFCEGGSLIETKRRARNKFFNAYFNMEYKQ